MSDFIHESPHTPTREPHHAGDRHISPRTPSQYVFDNGQFHSVITGKIYQLPDNGRVLSPGQAEGITALSNLRTSPPPMHIPPLAPVITATQLQELISQLSATIRRNHEQPPQAEEHLFSIAKSEYYISQGLTYKFDGITKSLPLGSRNSRLYALTLYGAMPLILQSTTHVMTS
jgi:hypothetical protein